jgi:hypothetical protein
LPAIREPDELNTRTNESSVLPLAGSMSKPSFWPALAVNLNRSTSSVG